MVWRVRARHSSCHTASWSTRGTSRIVTAQRTHLSGDIRKPNGSANDVLVSQTMPCALT